MTKEIREIWLNAFRDIEKFGIPHIFKPRQLVGLYAVASICYHGNETSLISDPVYDKLCKWLLINIEECKSEGADLLDAELLRCTSGYKVNKFVKPYHDIVTVILGVPCHCIRCQREAIE